MFPQFTQNLSNGFHVYFSITFYVDEHVIKVYNKKDVEFLPQDCVDITLKDNWGICQAK